MEKRLPGLDLLRCVALLFVVVFHSFLYNGYYGEAQTGPAVALAGGVRWLSVSCIGIFLMLTGYLKSQCPWERCLRGLVPVLLGYVLASAVSIPIRHFFLGDAQSVSVWLTRLWRFRGVYYGWYVELYVRLTLLMPFLNLLLAGLRTARGLLALAGAALLLTALPGATPFPIVPDIWWNAYPVTYYILGGVVRRLQPRLRPWVGWTAAAALALLLGVATALSTDGALKDALTWEFQDIWIVLMVLCLFVGLYQVRPGRRMARLLAFAAGGCYGGYLLSHLLDAWCYRLLPQWRTPARYPLLFLCVTVPIYILSILSGKLLEKAVSGLLSFGRERSVCR